MNDVVTLLLGGGLAATIIEAIKFAANYRQVKQKDTAAARVDSTTADVTVVGAWKDLWQTDSQRAKEFEQERNHERERVEKLIDLVQEAANLLPPTHQDAILDKLSVIRRF